MHFILPSWLYCQHFQLFSPFYCSLYTPLRPNSFANMCLISLRTCTFTVLAGPLTVCPARKANMTGSRQGGLLQFHHWDEEGGKSTTWLKKLAWVWSECLPHSFHSAADPYLFQMTWFCSQPMSLKKYSSQYRRKHPDMVVQPILTTCWWQKWLGN